MNPARRILVIAALLLGSTARLHALAPIPIGVYASWERVVSNARFMHQDAWEYFDSLLVVLGRHGLHWVWLTNFPIADIRRLESAGAANNQRFLVNMNETEIKVYQRDMAYYRETLPSAARGLPASSSIYAWVLSDEPTPRDAARIEQIAEVFRTIDPGRATAVVATHSEFGAFQGVHDVQILCVDVYPFFGPRDPNGPNTGLASQRFYRDVLSRTHDVPKNGKLFWVMMQSFSEIWGPRRFTHDFHLVGLPGSYLHWLQPPPAAIRWQFWEAVRSGATGFFYYTATPETPGPATSIERPPDVRWKSVLADTETDLGPNAIVNPDLSPTPQLATAESLARRLLGLQDVMSLWTPSRTIARVNGPGQAQVFRGDRGKEYVVVVNDELMDRARLTVTLPRAVRDAREISGAYPPQGTGEVTNDGRSSFTLLLSPGDGAVVELAP